MAFKGTRLNPSEQPWDTTNYTHPSDPNLSELHRAMDYNNSGQPQLRTMPGDAYARDIYHRPKVVQDFSTFSSEATLRVPMRVWEQEEFNLAVVPVTVIHKDIDGTHVLSEDHMLTVKSGTVADYGYAARTKEFFRVQPNRGGLYSWSAEYPSPNAAGNRAIGPSTSENGISLFLVGTGTSWTFYYLRQLNNAIVTQVDLAPYLPEGFDPAKGHLYDMRMQWRGVGNIEVFIDGVLIYTEEVLGTLTGVSVADNSSPFVISTSCAQAGVQVVLKVGCVDFSSEGGRIERTLFGSISTGELLAGIPAAGAAVLALRIPRRITYNGGSMYNTRGAYATKIVSWARSEALTQAWYGRDHNIPNLEALTWTAIPDSNMQYLLGGATSALETAFAADRSAMNLLVSEFQEQEIKNEITNPDPDNKFEIAPGSVLVIFIDPINNNIEAHSVLYYSEQL